MPALRDLLTPHPLPRPTGGAGARRRAGAAGVTLVAGAATLAATLSAPGGSTSFAVLGFLAAAVWWVGAAAAGTPPPRPSSGGVTAAALIVGAGAYLGFVAASVVAHRLPVLDDAVDSVLDRADAGPVALVLSVALANGVTEERFFRGALPLALPGRHRPAGATVLYVVVTTATLEPALVVAAAVMGPLLMVERLGSRGTWAPTVTHVTWSALMVLAFPR